MDVEYLIPDHNIKLIHNEQRTALLSSPLGDLPSTIVLFQQDAQEGMTRRGEASDE